jgi:hypothetical protein
MFGSFRPIFIQLATMYANCGFNQLIHQIMTERLRYVATNVGMRINHHSI